MRIQQDRTGQRRGAAPPPGRRPLRERTGARAKRTRGLSLMEVMVSMGILAAMSTLIMTFEVGYTTMYAEQSTAAFVRSRVRNALVVMSADIGRATTTAAGELATFDPGSGVNARAIQLREMLGGNTSGSIWGPTIIFAGPGATGDLASAGIVRLRDDNLHTTGGLNAFRAQQVGGDNLWGTLDDDCRLTQGKVSVMTLVPASMAPQTGSMFQVDLSGRLVTITIRANMRRGTTWVLPTDLVVTERVALLQ
jgi:hypothetical protein